MAITVSGTEITFNDTTTQATSQQMVTGPTSGNLSGVFSYTISGIPTNAKQIWLDMYFGSFSGGPNTGTLLAQNSSGTSGSLGGVHCGVATSSSICGPSQTNNLIGYSGSFYQMPTSLSLCLTLVGSYAGTGLYTVQNQYLTGSTSTARIYGQIAISGRVQQFAFSIAGGYSVSGFVTRVYWET